MPDLLEVAPLILDYNFHYHYLSTWDGCWNLVESYRVLTDYVVLRHFKIDSFISRLRSWIYLISEIVIVAPQAKRLTTSPPLLSSFTYLRCTLVSYTTKHATRVETYAIYLTTETYVILTFYQTLKSKCNPCINVFFPLKMNVFFIFLNTRFTYLSWSK